MNKSLNKAIVPFAGDFIAPLNKDTFQNQVSPKHAINLCVTVFAVVRYVRRATKMEHVEHSEPR